MFRGMESCRALMGLGGAAGGEAGRDDVSGATGPVEFTAVGRGGSSGEPREASAGGEEGA